MSTEPFSSRSAAMPGSSVQAGLSALPDGAYAAALTCLPRVGPAWLVDVLSRHSPGEAWAMVIAGELGPPSRPGPRRGLLAPGWSEAAQRLDVGRLWAHCRRHGVEVTWRGQPGYPSAFAEDPSPPGVVFSAGSLSTLEGRHCAALVGTRRCTPDGAAAAYELAYDLSRAGVCVVSGLALGIDGAAHAGALAAVRDREGADLEGDDPEGADLEGADLEGAGPGGAPRAGSTVGVAASGVDVVYPRQHRALWQEVVTLGAVVSETPPGRPAQAWRFPSRNRLIAGLAGIVVVVECHASGGSWHTVDAATNRGTEVGAVPGSIHSAASVGTNRLLHEGATPIRGAEDVLDALEMLGAATRGQEVPARHRPRSATSAKTRAQGARSSERQTLPLGVSWPVITGQQELARLGPLEEKVLAALGQRTLCLEDVVERSGLPAGAVVVVLDRLEDAGLVTADAGWWFAKPRR